MNTKVELMLMETKDWRNRKFVLIYQICHRLQTLLLCVVLLEQSLQSLFCSSMVKLLFPLYGLKVMWDNFPFFCNRQHDSCDGIPAIL